jgi:hypothetical protein
MPDCGLLSVKQFYRKRMKLICLGITRLNSKILAMGVDPTTLLLDGRHPDSIQVNQTATEAVR